MPQLTKRGKWVFGWVVVGTHSLELTRLKHPELEVFSL